MWPITAKCDVIYSNQKYIMYRNAAREGPSHVHGGSVQKNFVKIGPAVSEICSQTDRHTDRLIAICRSPTGAE